MPLYYDDDQTMLAETANQFMAEEGSIMNQLRHWRDRNCKDGFGHALWKQFGEMGFTGMLVGEDDGGLGMGQVEANIVLEEIGRNLTPSPFLSSSVLAATALKHGSNEVKGRWLPDLISGDKVYAVAIDEGPKHRPETIACKARCFFAAAHATSCRDRRAMHAQEKAFWARHKRLSAAISGAKRDRDDFCRVLMCLRRRLPLELSNRVLRMAV